MVHEVAQDHVVLVVLQAAKDPRASLVKLHIMERGELQERLAPKAEQGSTGRWALKVLEDPADLWAIGVVLAIRVRQGGSVSEVAEAREVRGAQEAWWVELALLAHVALQGQRVMLVSKVFVAIQVLADHKARRIARLL